MTPLSSMACRGSRSTQATAMPDVSDGSRRRRTRSISNCRLATRSVAAATWSWPRAQSGSSMAGTTASCASHWRVFRPADPVRSDRATPSVMAPTAHSVIHGGPPHHLGGTDASHALTPAGDRTRCGAGRACARARVRELSGPAQRPDRVRHPGHRWLEHLQHPPQRQRPEAADQGLWVPLLSVLLARRPDHRLLRQCEWFLGDLDDDGEWNEAAAAHASWWVRDLPRLLPRRIDDRLRRDRGDG